MSASGLVRPPLADPRVRAEVVALLYGNAGVGVLMNLASVPVLWLTYQRMLPAVPLLAGLGLWTLLQGLSAWNRWQWNQLQPEVQGSEAVSATFLRRANGMAWLLSAGVAIFLAVLHFATTPATPGRP